MLILNKRILRIDKPPLWVYKKSPKSQMARVCLLTYLRSKSLPGKLLVRESIDPYLFNVL
jgi:hypothetical protein